ncbi:hypothetical protein [Chryseobacterium gallinarum]|nr:hypothetical protein [Chryseobacterium gallinarum]
MENDFFNNISINGRYIYGYLCLNSFFSSKNTPDLPESLKKDIEEFVSSDRLDIWHENIEEVLPSIIINNSFNSGYYEIIDEKYYNDLREYYTNIGSDSCNLIENLLNIGASNLFGAFDSTISIKYLNNIISILKDNNVYLPDPERVAALNVEEKNGWGNTVSMKDYLPFQ